MHKLLVPHEQLSHRDTQLINHYHMDNGVLCHSGKIVIPFKSDNDLKRILDLLDA